MLAHTSVAPDLALAKARAAEAQAALAKAVEDVRAAERRSGAPGTLGPARQRRAAIADTWRLNARAWVAGAPQDAAAKASFAAAEKAASDYAMPAGIEPD